jgi:hypothetical protein
MSLLGVRAPVEKYELTCTCRVALIMQLTCNLPTAHLHMHYPQFRAHFQTFMAVVFQKQHTIRLAVPTLVEGWHESGLLNLEAIKSNQRIAPSFYSFLSVNFKI